jgi:hypothetical protein
MGRATHRAVPFDDTAHVADDLSRVGGPDLTAGRPYATTPAARTGVVRTAGAVSAGVSA